MCIRCPESRSSSPGKRSVRLHLEMKHTGYRQAFPLRQLFHLDSFFPVSCSLHASSLPLLRADFDMCDFCRNVASLRISYPVRSSRSGTARYLDSNNKSQDLTSIYLINTIVSDMHLVSLVQVLSDWPCPICINTRSRLMHIGGKLCQEAQPPSRIPWLSMIAH